MRENDYCSMETMEHTHSKPAGALKWRRGDEIRIRLANMPYLICKIEHYALVRLPARVQRQHRVRRRMGMFTNAMLANVVASAGPKHH